MFRFIAILVILCQSYLPSSGQIAPDFTFTDINGTVHNLQHALDQNYTILVEFFFADCGPCITAAAELQDIHEDYVGKNVLVWAISDIDDDERIELFHEEMGLGFISGGVEGGGVEILDQFAQNNQFIAYPTVAVICPNGELTWDIYPYSLGAPEWRTAIEKCGVEDAAPYEPYGNLTAAIEVPLDKKMAITLAPNPATDFVKVMIAEANSSAVIEVGIYSAVGQFLKTVKQLPMKSSQSEMLISTTDLENGVYFLKIKMEEQREDVLKLIIEN